MFSLDGGMVWVVVVVTVTAIWASSKEGGYDAAEG
jgi:hypothetical protein